jgi:predicted AAA+ superfamily ATPase
MTPFNATEFLNIYDENWQHYLTNIQQYREVTMLLYIGLSKNVNGMIENAIEFIEGMILSRLIMLIFN